MARDDGVPEWREVSDLARDLLLARTEPPDRGKAVFLVGAGCSVSAGIPAAAGVAKHCAFHLARSYSGGAAIAGDPEAKGVEALEWLVGQGHVPREVAYGDDGRTPAWTRLYTHFFERHFKAPNQQRRLMVDIVEAAGGGLNWAHACLGELVSQRFVHSVLTTNFDQLVLKGIFRAGIVPVVADGMAALNRIVARPLVPQVVHLHGSMNTYGLRNSRRSMAETREDLRAATMVNGMLQQCDVLVIVGYAGGEEGVMHLLLEAAQHHEQLVIYWVVYENDVAKLSTGCRALLAGENKFAINGGEADKFFAELMTQLKVGQPAWVKEPMADLSRQAGLLRGADADPTVAALLEAFRARVAAGTEAVVGWGSRDGRKLAATNKRAAGDYEGARAELVGVELEDDPVAARLHAMNALSLFEADPTASRRKHLDAAIGEFTGLVERTEGVARRDNVLSLIKARFDLFELEGDPRHLGDVVAIATRHLDGDRGEDGKLLYNRALAHHWIADAGDEGVEGLERAERDYRAALASGNAFPDLEVREGLAAALEVLGAKKRDVGRLEEAVTLFRDVAERSRRNDDSPEGGGHLYNLSGALLALADVSGGSQADPLLAEAADCLARATRAFDRADNSEMLPMARARMEAVATMQGRSGGRPGRGTPPDGGGARPAGAADGA